MSYKPETVSTNDLSREYFARALRVSPGGVHSPVRAFKGVGGAPIFFRSAQGGTMTSVDGREYIDFCQSFGPLMLGHRDPDVAEAVQEAIATAWSFGACEPYSLELAEWIRSEEHTSELQSRLHLVCRLLLEKKKNKQRSQL